MIGGEKSFPRCSAADVQFYKTRPACDRSYHWGGTLNLLIIRACPIPCHHCPMCSCVQLPYTHKRGKAHPSRVAVPRCQACISPKIAKPGPSVHAHLRSAATGPCKPFCLLFGLRLPGCANTGIPPRGLTGSPRC